MLDFDTIPYTSYIHDTVTRRRVWKFFFFFFSFFKIKSLDFKYEPDTSIVPLVSFLDISSVYRFYNKMNFFFLSVFTFRDWRFAY